MRRTKRLYSPIVLLALIWVLMGETGCTAGQPGNDTVATVGDVKITRQELVDQLLANSGAQTLRTLMLRIAVDKEAAAAGIAVTDEEVEQELERLSEGYGGLENYFSAMREQLGLTRDEVRKDALYRLKLERIATMSVNVTDEEIDRYLKEHAEDFGPKTELQLSHIVTENRDDAEKVLKKLEDGGDFAELAQEFSVDGWTASQGGDLGWMEIGDPFVDQAVVDAVSELEVGQIAGPIETEAGYEIVMLTGRKDTPAMGREAARQEARRRLALDRAEPMAELEQALLDKYGAEIRDPELKL